MVAYYYILDHSDPAEERAIFDLLIIYPTHA